MNLCSTPLSIPRALKVNNMTDLRKKSPEEDMKAVEKGQNIYN